MIKDEQLQKKCDTIENENPNNRRNPLVANNVNVKKTGS